MKRLRILAAIVLVAITIPALAQEATGKDDSGTNPLNFTYDFRIYMELQEFNAEGDNGAGLLTFEYRFPLANKWQFRTRLRGVSQSLDPEGDGSSETTTGIGDFDARVIYVARATKKRAVAVGAEAFFDTASSDVLGEGKTSLAPAVFYVFFNPGGVKGTLFAPAYQYVFDVAGDDDRADVDRHVFDFYYVWLASNKKHWAIIDPQLVIDNEGDRDYGQIELEWGQMMFGPTSSYIRPGFGVGGDRPLDWNIELGFKVIWR
jgi:hypothetical protein